MIPHALRSKNDAHPIIQAIYDIEKKHLEKTGVMLKEIDTTRETDGDLTAAMEAANTEDNRGAQDPSTISQHEPLVSRQEGTAEIADLSIPSPANAYEAENSVVETEELADSPTV